MSSELLGALTAGRAARAAGQPVTSCPYPRTAPEAVTWVRGYTAAQLDAAGWPPAR